MSAFWHDLRYALRSLRNSPGLALSVVLTLALGLGANTAVFTVLESILLRPLSYADPDRIVAVSAVNPTGDTGLSYADMLQLAARVKAHLRIAVNFDSRIVNLESAAGRRQVEQVQVTANLPELLGVQPRIGRTFRANENDPGKSRVVLLSDAVWRRFFSSDPQIVGKTVRIQSQPYIVIGVMPRSFSFPPGAILQVWMPKEITAADRTDLAGEGYFNSLLARLPANMTAAQAAAELNRVQAQVAAEHPKAFLPKRVTVTEYQRSLNGRVRTSLGLLCLVVLTVWALACLNVISLMLARSVARSREFSVRSALGASRLRLAQHSLIESLLLSALGSGIGLSAAVLSIKLLWRPIQRALPLASRIHLDWRIILALLLLTLLTALLVGLLPVLRLLHWDPQRNLHGDVAHLPSPSEHRGRAALVVAQLAITLVLLTCAGLFLRTIDALERVPLGFSQQNVLTSGILLNLPRPAGNGPPPDVIHNIYGPLLDKLRAIPGVQAAALSSVVPMRSQFQVTITGDLDYKKLPRGQSPRAQGRIATPGLIETFGIPLLRGRFFDADDTASSPVVIVVNRAFVDRYLHGLDPIGHTLSLGKGRYAEMRIVGVIGDVKQGNVERATMPEVYLCLAQITPDAPFYFVATTFMQAGIRAAVPAETLRHQFEEAMHEVAPDATTNEIETIHQTVEDSFGSQALTAHLLEGFSILALLIGSVGLYGLLAFSVAQRTREIGVRIALGASEKDVLGLIFGRALRLIVAGLAIGVAAAWFATTLIRGYLFGVQAHDPVTSLAAISLLVLAGLLAAYLPARRAASVNPMQALRTE